MLEATEDRKRGKWFLTAKVAMMSSSGYWRRFGGRWSVFFVSCDKQSCRNFNPCFQGKIDCVVPDCSSTNFIWMRCNGPV